MNRYNSIVLQAMKDTSPELHEYLTKSRGLDKYVDDLADLIASEINRAVQEARASLGWDKLGPLQLEQNLNTARKMYEDQVLEDLLEFPTDDDPNDAE